MIKGLALALTLFVVLMAVGWCVTNYIATELNSQTELEQETIDTINNIKDNYEAVNIYAIALGCIAFALFIIGVVVTKGKILKNNYSDITGDDIFPIESKENKKEDAVSILKRRFANGEIDSCEYTEKMARL